MKGTRRSKVWLALGLVAAACLVLAGCPHNGLLDNSGGGGAGSGGGGRGGSDGVQLVITNFVSEEGAANRSTSWLGGPQKTIVPEHIDLKARATDYVFIATGKGGGTYGPEFVDVDANGFASLNISDGGTWEVTISAYEVAKLPGVAGGVRNDIMRGNPNDVIAVPNALILQGKATVDLSGGSQVTMTLTGDGVGTEGGVEVTINLETPTDVTEINNTQGKGRYKVKAALYDYTNGGVLMKTVAGGGATTEVEIHDGQSDINKTEVYTVTNVPRGHYNFRLTVTTDTGTPVAYWSDDIVVEGNRTTKDTVNIYNLFNTPSDPTDFEVYWSKKRTGDAKEGYLAYFSWAGMSYNAAGMEIQIADITKWYSYDEGASQYKVNFDGEQVLADHDDLWTEIDTLTELTTVKFSDVVTTLSWKNSPQDATEYPAIWQEGSLMNGSRTGTFLMQTGRVYSARVRADGGLKTSNWLILGAGTAGTSTPNVLSGVVAGGQATKFELPETNGLFDLHEMFYDLGDNNLLYQTQNATDLGTVAVADKLSVYREYNPDQGWYDVDMKYNNMQTPTMADWFIYKRTPADGLLDTLDDRTKTWTGWKNKYNPAERFVFPAWGEYKGHDNLHLLPLGAGGSVTVQAETSGTFNVLTADTVLVEITNDGNLVAFGELSNGDDHPVPGTGDAKTTRLALMNDAGNNRYILNLDAGGVNTTWLHLSAGAAPTQPGILEDNNTNNFTVEDITVTLVKGKDEVKTFDKVGKHEAKAQLDGMLSGDYTLRVVIKASSGYSISYQTSMVIKYNDQVIR